MLGKQIEEYAQALQNQREYMKKLTTEKEALEKQLNEEINRKVR